MKRPFVGDIAVTLVALLIMLAALVPWRGAGGQVEIIVQGRGPQVFSLDSRQVLTFQLQYDNTIEIKDGQARFAQSTCPNQTCVHTGWISHSGQAAVCTATGVVIRIVGSEIDTVLG